MKKSTFSVFIWRQAKWQIIFVISIFLIGVSCFLYNLAPFADQWDSWLEALITFSIVFMAIFIWYNEQRQDWENSLPKKLNIAYMLGKEKVYCRVLNAPLASESDIRTWATSIAGTILNKKVFFNFSGFFMEKPRVNKKKGMMIYYLDIFIDEPIKGISEGDDIVFFDNGLLDKSSFTVPEENDKDQP
jgi:hypothetical protein